MFGAYGWGETIGEMTYIIDHMVVRGINRFIPHAFSMKEKDDDCPPHFYANGTNPSYKAFGKLMEYTNRLLEKFQGPGHGESTTLASEKRYNPYMQ